MGEVYVFDDMKPEDNAMIQALYSRSPKSVIDHRNKVAEVGSGNFVQQYYVGYGHKSIGDCGNTTIFVEDVSMLVAKAIQDSGLYNGQEASTRYLDFSQQRIHDPFNHPYTTRIQQGWVDLYNQYLPITIEALKKIYPFSPESAISVGQYEKAIRARAFDIVRSLLPIGTTTNLSWDTTLSHARAHVRFLYDHPLFEVHGVVNQIHDQLYEKYPHSFDKDIHGDSDREKIFFDTQAEDPGNYYLDYKTVMDRLPIDDYRCLLDGDVIVTTKAIDIDSINEDHVDALRRRGRTPLPRYLTQYGMYNFYSLLDFASFRDIQRHRNGFCPIPLVTGDYGFHDWYDDQFKSLLSVTEYRILRNRIKELIQMANDVDHHVPIVDKHEKQYLYPMGIACVIQLAYGLPQSVYVTELRSDLTVHDSLRQMIHKVGDILEAHHPELNLFMNREKESFSLKRGTHDIVERKLSNV